LKSLLLVVVAAWPWSPQETWSVVVGLDQP